MDDRSTDVIQGTLDMLILKSLSLEPMHGYGIARRIEQISKGVFKVNPGSLMLAFKRMERAGLIDSEWRPTENNRHRRLPAPLAAAVLMFGQFVRPAVWMFVAAPQRHPRGAE